MKKILTLTLITLTFSISAQRFEKIVLDETSNDYFLAMEPKNPSQVKGVLVLMPGFGQDAESIFPESKLPNVAYLHNYLTIAVAGGRKLYADQEVIKKLDDTLNYVISQWGVGEDQFFIGGFSAGGTISLRYAEYCNEEGSPSPIKPQGVFAVDSPVDLFHIWDYFQREIRKNYSEAGVGEAEFVSEIMRKEIGEPDSDQANYDRLTPFNANLLDSGNEKYLADIPTRVYHDVDINWQLDNRRRSLYDSNALPSSEMINRLKLLGNDQAEFMVAKQPGYRSIGFRHPHSWSIVDEVELIQWMNNILDGDS